LPIRCRNRSPTIALKPMRFLIRAAPKPFAEPPLTNFRGQRRSGSRRLFLRLEVPQTASAPAATQPSQYRSGPEPIAGRPVGEPNRDAPNKSGAAQRRPKIMLRRGLAERMNFCDDGAPVRKASLTWWKIRNWIKNRLASRAPGAPIQGAAADIMHRAHH
jgi:hypothetical protein